MDVKAQQSSFYFHQTAGVFFYILWVFKMIRTLVQTLATCYMILKKNRFKCLPFYYNTRKINSTVPTEPSKVRMQNDIFYVFRGVNNVSVMQ